MSKIKSKIFPLAKLALVTVLVIFGSSSSSSREIQSTQTIVRDLKASGKPVAIPNRSLALVRYVIPPGYKLPPHTHPGMQIATIEEGVLTYNAVKGSAKIFRGKDRSVEILKAGEKTLLFAGDSLVEPEGMIHFGSNNENTPLVLWGATLFLNDRPPSQIVEENN
ncbi:MAG: cupin domain-containing protein [Prochloraceae cyanobacterium]|nr:cupin domain-containing protein [Prochloraceae cyanobacterium]